jgi:hypothetical protein
VITSDNGRAPWIDVRKVPLSSKTFLFEIKSSEVNRLSSELRMSFERARSLNRKANKSLEMA